MRSDNSSETDRVRKKALNLEVALRQVVDYDCLRNTEGKACNGAHEAQDVEDWGQGAEELAHRNADVVVGENAERGGDAP